VPADRWVQGVADERAFYTRDRVALVDAAGAELRRFFAGLPVRVLAVGSEMRIACRSEASVVIEAHGLTDTRIARQPLGVRGRVGHEHLADLEYVTRERRAHFMFHPPWSEYPNFRDVSPVVPAKLGSSVLYVLTWDAPLMAELSRRGAEIPDFPQTLDRYLAGIGALSDEAVQRDYVRCKNFYFNHVADPAREAVFRRRLHLP
jgi:hypothetical protein